jgi:hypothetical protein
MRFAATLLLLLCAAGAVAQTGNDPQATGTQTAAPPANLPAASLKKGTWDLGVWTGGGHALTGSTSGTGVWNAGFRFGRVMTQEHGPGWLRGNLEWSGDIIPAYVIFQNTNVYGAGFNPALFKWNFTRGKKIAPYFEMGAGMLFTRSDVPAGTSTINFTPQAGFGMHIFTRQKRAVTLTGKYVHISNAGLSTPNPGINTIQFTVGYNWFH